MSSLHVSGFVGFLTLCVVSALGHAADLNSPVATPDVQKAQQLAEQALRFEAEGDLVARDRLIGEAMQSDADCAMARWHGGWYKTTDGMWQSVEEFLAGAAKGQASSESLVAYESRRAVAVDNAAGQWLLAAWCMSNGLGDQAKAHLARTLEFSPGHVGARRMLGFRLMGGEWLSAQQQEELTARAANVRLGLTKYGKTLTTLARQFKSRHKYVRDAARAELLAITDTLAIAPIEAILGSANSEATLAAVACLSAIDDVEATQALVRFAMFHPHLAVQRAAISEVNRRPYDDYVPELLQLLSSPVVSMAMPVISESGMLTGFRQSFAQERSEKTDVFVLDTAINYDGTTGNGRTRRRLPEVSPTDLASQLEAAQRATERAQQNSDAIQADNRRIVARNKVILNFLSEVTEREFVAPADVWKWWDERNETEYQSPLKPSTVRYSTSQLTSRNYSALALEAAMPTTFAGECFVSGTPVMTRKGLKAIESVMVGDLVLSRAVSTGELCWKPVLRTTIRPARPVLELSLDTEKISCTGGHLFWVSGKGWMKASQLRAGDVLHGAAQPTVVMSVAQQPQRETYNLAVDKTHSYFVGKQLVLSHDVTSRTPTRNLVPGLLPLVATTSLAP